MKARTKDDKEVNDYNLLIRKEVSRINEIFMTYHLNGNPLNMEILRLEYFEPSKAENFIEYIPEKILKRLKRKELRAGSKKVNFQPIKCYCLINKKLRITILRQN